MHNEVIIVGGGLNGPALALALAQAGLEVTVIDAAPPGARAGAAVDGRAYALAAASQRLLAAIGVWPRVAEEAQPILDIVASQGRAGAGAGRFALHFDHAELEEGPMGFILEDRFLFAALAGAMAAHPRIRLLPGTTVTGQRPIPGGIAADTTAGPVEGRLLVGADGRGSGTAARAGIARTGWPYRQTALVAAIGHEAPHRGAAHQFFMPDGPLAILPLKGGHASSIVWSLDETRAAGIDALDDAGFLAALRPAFGDFLGPIRLAGPRFRYPLSLSLADAWTAERLALLGDAAHGVHPIAGQGLNLGLRDVAALAQVVAEAHRRGQDIGDPLVLADYVRWRRFDATRLALGMDAVNRLFSNDSRALAALRGLGMGLVQALPPLRRGFMREAAGLAGDRPRLLEGRPA